MPELTTEEVPYPAFPQEPAAFPEDNDEPVPGLTGRQATGSTRPQELVPVSAGSGAAALPAETAQQTEDSVLRRGRRLLSSSGRGRRHERVQ